MGLLAAALVALDPLQFAASASLMTEAAFSLALLSVVGIGFRVFQPRAPRVAWYALLGIGISTATLIRPTTYYLPVFAVALLIVHSRRWGARAVARNAVVFVLPVVVMIGGWQIRNHYEVGSWRYSGIEAISIYGDRAAYVLARHEGISVDAANQRLARQLSSSRLATCHAGKPCLPARPSRPGPFYDELYRRGFDILKEYPVTTLQESGRGLARDVFGPGTETVGRVLGVEHSTLLKLVLEGFLLCMYAGFAYGLVLVWRRARGYGLAHVFAVGTAGYVLLVSAQPEANARFRTPVMPILALYAALGLTTACNRVRHSLHRTTRVVSAG